MDVRSDAVGCFGCSTRQELVAGIVLSVDREQRLAVVRLKNEGEKEPDADAVMRTPDEDDADVTTYLLKDISLRVESDDSGSEAEEEEIEEQEEEGGETQDEADDGVSEDSEDTDDEDLDDLEEDIQVVEETPAGRP